MISYIQFPKKRKPEYNLYTVRTDVLPDFLYAKLPVTDEALPFLQKVSKNYTEIEKQMDFHPVPCVLQDNALYFKQACGQSFTTHLHTLFTLRKKEAFLNMLDIYYDILCARAISPQKGQATMGTFFAQPTIDIKDASLVLPIGCIDASFDNMYYEQEKQTHGLIDYEWVFPCVIPVKYILWRSLYMFYKTHKNTSLNIFYPMDDIYKHFHISKAQRAVYFQYEYLFQKYVLEHLDYTQSDLCARVERLESFHPSLTRKYTPAMQRLIALRKKLNKYDIFGLRFLHAYLMKFKNRTTKENGSIV